MLDPNDEVRGRGELRLRDAGIHVARFDSELMPVIEEMSRDFLRLHRHQAPIRRTVGQAADPVPEGEVGPNGFPIGYTSKGDKVEWIDDAEEEEVWPLLLRRNDNAILAEYSALWDKVWYNRHQNWAMKVGSGEQVLSSKQTEIFATASAKARELEERYGKKNLIWDDFEWGLLSGRMSALAWVLGAEWEESLDT